MKLLITGGSGFIGSNLIRYLLSLPDAGIEKIINLDCLTYAGDPETMDGDFFEDERYSARWINLCNKDQVCAALWSEGPTHVMHLAAESHVDRSISQAHDFVLSNVVGTANLLDACRAYWAPRNQVDHLFLQVSTDEVFGSLDVDSHGMTEVFSEGSKYDPQSPYSATKAAADMLVRSFVNTHNFPAIITHSCNNYGPRQHAEKFIPTVIQAALTGEAIPIYGDGKYYREWIHVDDHCDALWQVLTRGRIGESYCIGSGNEFDNVAVATRICGLVDVMLGADPGTTAKSIVFVADRPGHDRRYAVSSAKLRHYFQWQPKTGLNEGLKQTIEWYKDNQDWIRWMKHRTKPTPAPA